MKKVARERRLEAKTLMNFTGHAVCGETLYQ